MTFRHLADERSLCVAWGATAAITSVAHATLALCAGLLARSVATMPFGADGVPTTLLFGGMPPVLIASVGLIAAGVKAIAGGSLASFEHRLAGRVARRARLQATAELLAWGGSAAAPTLLARLATRCGDVERGVRLGILGTVRAVLQLIPLAVCLVALAPRLSIVALSGLCVFGFAATAARQRWKAASGRAQEAAERLHTEIDELVSHVDLWRTYGASTRVLSTLETSSERAIDADAHVARGRAWLSGSNEVLAATALVIATVTVTAREAGSLLAFAAVFFMAYRPIRALGDARSWLAHGEQALAALDSFGRSGHDAFAVTPARRFRLAEPLRLVEFGARGRGPRINVTVHPRSIVLLRGKTGSGKTTLLRALLGLEEGTGRLTYGDRSIDQAGVGLCERPFAWVPQDAPLITATLRENVGLAAETDEAIDDAIRRVMGAGLAKSLSDDRLGPGGRPVSGGQRRLVALSRALATEQPILLLDEPTEGLDPEATRNVIDALQHLRTQRTLVIATHRPEVAAIADQVVDLDAPCAAAAE